MSYPNDMLHPTYLLGAIKERPDTNAIRQNYIWSTLLPKRDVSERHLMWDSVASENNLAGFYSYKGQAIPGEDTMFSSHFADLIDVKASRVLDPDIIQKVRDPGMLAVVKNAGDSFLARELQARVRDHISGRLAWCDDAVEAQLEYMAVNAMLGTLEWPPKDANGNVIAVPMPHWNADQSMTITFPLLANFKQNASTLSGYKARAGGGFAWTNANANPILDLEVIAELMVETKGIDPSNARIIMSRSTLSRIAFLPNVLSWITGTSNAAPAPGYADVEQVKSFIKTRLGYEIETYDAQWTYKTHNEGAEPTISRVKFLPEGRVLIIPKGVTAGFMAMAPHETQTGQWMTGKIPWVVKDQYPPYERFLGVNTIAFPILTRPEEHFSFDVYN